MYTSTNKLIFQEIGINAWYIPNIFAHKFLNFSHPFVQFTSMLVSSCNAYSYIPYTFIGTDTYVVKCYQTSTCGEDLMQDSPSNNSSTWTLVGSVEDCCLQHPFQPRSFQMTGHGSPCHECIGKSETVWLVSGVVVMEWCLKISQFHSDQQWLGLKRVWLIQLKKTGMSTSKCSSIQALMIHCLGNMMCILVLVFLLPTMLQKVSR